MADTSLRLIESRFIDAHSFQRLPVKDRYRTTVDTDNMLLPESLYYA